MYFSHVARLFIAGYEKFSQFSLKFAALWVLFCACGCTKITFFGIERD